MQMKGDINTALAPQSPIPEVAAFSIIIRINYTKT